MQQRNSNVAMLVGGDDISVCVFRRPHGFTQITHRVVFFFNPPWDLVSEKCVFGQRKRQICVDGGGNLFHVDGALDWRVQTFSIHRELTTLCIPVNCYRYSMKMEEASE